jgi:hypothetical protein
LRVEFAKLIDGGLQISRTLQGLPELNAAFWEIATLFYLEYGYSMRRTVDIPGKDMKDILRFSGVKKKGPAIVKLVASQLMLRRRRELSDEVMTGKFRVELPDWAESRQREREENTWDRHKSTK